MILDKSTQEALANAFDAAANAGTGAAYVRFETSGDANVVQITMSNPMFGDASTAGVLALTAGTYSASKTSSGTATVAQLSVYTSAAQKVAEFTCAATGAEVTISNASIAKGDTIQLTALGVTMPAS